MAKSLLAAFTPSKDAWDFVIDNPSPSSLRRHMTEMMRSRPECFGFKAALLETKTDEGVSRHMIVWPAEGMFHRDFMGDYVERRGTREMIAYECFDLRETIHVVFGGIKDEKWAEISEWFYTQTQDARWLPKDDPRRPASPEFKPQ